MLTYLASCKMYTLCNQNTASFHGHLFISKTEIRLRYEIDIREYHVAMEISGIKLTLRSSSVGNSRYMIYILLIYYLSTMILKEEHRIKVRSNNEKIKIGESFRMRNLSSTFT